MTIDLILWASTKADLRTFAIANNLVTVVDGQDKLREGFEWAWWGETGKLMTSPGNRTLGDRPDPDDAPVGDLPTYAPGFVVICRIHGSFFDDDRIANPADGENWSKSKIARFIKNNGTQGTMAGVQYYELDGVRIFRPADLQAKLTEWGVPGHEWLGGNQY